MTEVVGGGRNPVSSLGEVEVVVAELGRAVESRWRRLMMTEAGVVDVDGGGWSEGRRWTCIVDGGSRVVVVMASKIVSVADPRLVVDGRLEETALAVCW